MSDSGQQGTDGRCTYDAPFAVGVLVRQVEGDGKDVDVGEGLCEPSTPVFDIGPVWQKVTTRYE